MGEGQNFEWQNSVQTKLRPTKLLITKTSSSHNFGQTKLRITKTLSRQYFDRQNSVLGKKLHFQFCLYIEKNEKWHSEKWSTRDVERSTEESDQHLEDVGQDRSNDLVIKPTQSDQMINTEWSTVKQLGYSYFSPLASAKGYSAAGSKPASSVDRTDVLAITPRRLLHSLRN